ncbi:MAG: argininosuccinate lyase, argininosuccinate lyase [Candidatus Peregrinibacteria bacterium GW2011_GWC2_39_14]|nr:MAG: Argininosuccinate lyase [Candidatus Peregrinibacteria bacterium GW2011_GWA2_38_36]KKR06561.1 MAG: argininosuccinate lyase, argininosuccinate lyase [Candidatus Peregrinibacteria bacterium GW2011_GWC2_39_14]
MPKTTPKKPILRKLWYKASAMKIDPVVEEYNAGEDILRDQELIPYDVQGSLGYGKMLHRHGIITAKELEQLKKGLAEITKLYNAGKFVLTVEDEDCHTKIENYLVENYGEIGKKIHTARSRNDQILVTERLFMKDRLADMKKVALKLAKDLVDMAKKYEFMPMPGYTHMQKAMPTSVGTWYGAFAENLLDDIKMMIAISDTLVDQNPLGSGAGFGSPFAFDRDKLSADLGFKRTQSNVIYCHNSRGRIAGMTLEACIEIMLTLNKLACDLLFFTTQEFNFFHVPDNISTGSSIMPQKKNLDVCELIRGRTATVVACRSEMIMNYINKISGYHRDGQEIKRPLFLGLRYTKMSLEAMSVVIKNIVPNEEKLLDNMVPELFSAHKAFEMVKGGMSFRDAYREVGSHLKEIKIDKSSIVSMLKQSKHQGGVGNLGLDKLAKEIEKLSK